MAGIWFKPGNLAAKAQTDYLNNGLMEAMYSSNKMAFRASIIVDSSMADKVVQVMSIRSAYNDYDKGNVTNITIENGLLIFKSYDSGTIKMDAAWAEVLPFDTAFELEVIFGGPYPYIAAKKNGTALTATKHTGTNNHQIFNGSYEVFLGGNENQIPQAEGLMFIHAQLSNDNNIPADNYAYFLVTRWDWDFEDEIQPFKIVTRRNGTISSLDMTVTYQPENVVWTSGNTPPADSGGGGGGGIVVPGNGNTTQVQGIITENDLPVARRVFAITEAELTIAGSQETTQAVLSNTVSSDIDGSYTLDTSPYEGSVMVIASDDYGLVWKADTAYAVGDVIRPANFQGYVYHCTVAGTGDATEPVWWFDTSSTKTIGTAQFQAKPFSRPLAHGPIIPTIIPSV